jgi:hypothetical protein
MKKEATAKEKVRSRLRKAMETSKVPAAEIAKMTEDEEVEDLFVETQQDLADELGIARETVVRWGREPGSPRRRKGKYNVVEWKTWMSDTGKSGGTPEPPSPMKSELEIRKLTAVCERLELEQKIRLGQYHTNDDCTLWVSKAMTAVRTILLSLPSKMAPVVEMRPKEEVEMLIREAIDEALVSIHEKEWPSGKKS